VLGLESADTEWVTFLDDDDVLYPTHVERYLALPDVDEPRFLNFRKRSHLGRGR
jgi:hypothetical protein